MVSANASSALAQSNGFQGIGLLSGARETPTKGLSADGTTVVGGAAIPGGREDAYRWHGNALAGLGQVTPNGDEATATNGDGSVVVGWTQDSSSSPSRAFLWSNGILFSLGTLADNHPHPTSFAYGVSTDGNVVVGSSSSSGIIQPFRWRNGTMTGLGTLAGFNFFGSATGTNADGSVVVGYVNSGVSQQAFRWENGTMTGLGFLNGGTFSQAYAVSGDGTVVVGSARDGNGGQNRAVKWINGVMSVLPQTPRATNNSEAFAVNYDGSVIVGYDQDPASNVEAVRWTAADGAQTILGLLGPNSIASTWNSLERANGVSADGTVISGYGRDPANAREGWIARISLPNPSTSLLSAVLPTARTSSPLPAPATDFATVTAFATVINNGPALARATAIALPFDVSGELHYQTTDSTNATTGTADTPIDIQPGQAQSFVFSVKPTATFSKEIPLVFQSPNALAAPVVNGLNTFLLSVSNAQIPDMLSIAATPSADGILNIAGTTGSSAFGGASIDIAAAGTVTFTPTDAPFGQPAKGLPLNLSICLTNAQGQCFNPQTPGSSATATVNNGDVLTFSVFASANGQAVPFDPANNRIFVIVKQGTTAVGETSVAVRTQ